MAKQETTKQHGGKRTGAGRPPLFKEKSTISVEVDKEVATRFREGVKEDGTSQPKKFTEWVDADYPAED